MRPRITPEKARVHGRAFGQEADRYDRVRPGYPDTAVEALLDGLPEAPRVLDLGAGTGKLSGHLVSALERRRAPEGRGEHGMWGEHGAGTVVAVDPDAAALQRNPAAEVHVGTGEEIPLPDASVDLVTIAQAWHWMEPAATCREVHRVLVPGGRLAILVNQLDVREPWVHRLSRIMHAGDVYRPAWRPEVGEGFSAVEAATTAFTQPMTTADLVDLAATRSYWLRSGEATRQKVADNLRWYLEEHLGHHPETVLDLPYLCLRYTTTKV
ncbi:class I SAM-dependent methyltransferase [Brevibacterium litoralis]|uniref:class I SAM-dependent methyltransferase n=1 Tax=Brevibacterium litoralis TaxID=3138935 RepID=UPI0032EABB8A